MDKTFMEVTFEIDLEDRNQLHEARLLVINELKHDLVKYSDNAVEDSLADNVIMKADCLIPADDGDEYQRVKWHRKSIGCAFQNHNIKFHYVEPKETKKS